MMVKKHTKPVYWDSALKHLHDKDKVLSSIICKYKSGTYLTSSNSTFKTFFSIIVGQQISIEAANSIEKNIKSNIGSITPNNFLRQSDHDLRRYGLSYRKIRYIKEIAVLINDNPSFLGIYEI